MTDADKLTSLLEEGAIDEILGQLQSGKEASVFVVRRAGEVVAAKVYKERDRRSFKNSAVYTEGRKTRSSRDERALARGSRHGKATQEAAWKSAESETLAALHRAGVRVPTPIAFHDGVVLMELVRDAHGEPAPRLIDLRPSSEQAKEWHRILLGEIVKMLLSGTVHGDLSAYNVLLAARGPVIIDFPQSVSASHNTQARHLVERDVRNVTDFLAGFDPSLARFRNAGSEIWSAYQRGDLLPDYVPGATTTDHGDDLAAQIAAATAMPHSVGRALGRKVSATLAPPPAPGPEERPASPPARTQGKRRRGKKGAQPGPRREHAPTRREQPRHEQPRRDQPRRDQPRREQPRREQPRREQPPRHEGRPQRGGVWDHMADRYGLGHKDDSPRA